MTEKLDFSLPQKKPQGSATGKLTVLLLIILVVLAAANLVAGRRGRSPESVSGGGLSAEQVRTLAARLAQRNLYQQAAAAWQDYLATAGCAGAEQARIHFQIGDLLEKAGLYADAIEHYYRSETVAEVKELGPQINARIKECFERLGKFTALRYELMDRTSLDASQPAGGKVVAEIGAEKITEAQLDARLEENLENQLAPMQGLLTPEQFNEQKKRALEQARDPKTKQEFLQGWLAQEILYRQALQEKLGDKPEVQRVVHDLTRQALSQQLMNDQLAAKIHITDSDLQMYYAANKDKYTEPEQAQISHVLVREEGQANELLKRARDGADFAALAKELSLDEATKSSGGRIAQEVTKGAYVPGIGDANEINAAIFAAGAPAVLEKPFKTEKGWEVIKVEQKRAARQKSFEEVSQQVAMQLLRQKREEVQRQYIQEMMDKHQVVIHTSAFAPAPQAAPKETPSQP
ncbi:MAG: peptidyl-prolyl cis-trans isomerase [Planctomycetes bacterium]|nr:peptidyl-prolyl cis-trans isomerase [Planctomycetota bacterium]